jgi:catechol 2,3-dioxygenase
MTTETITGVPTQLGHVALRVHDVDRSVEWYTEVLGLKLKHRMRGVAFLGIREDASHEVALFPLPAEAEGPDKTRVGLYHFAWEMPSFEALEQLHDRLVAKQADICGYSPAKDSTNVMFRDPDGNEMEAIWEPSKETLEEAERTGVPIPRLKQVIPS